MWPNVCAIACFISSLPVLTYSPLHHTHHCKVPLHGVRLLPTAKGLDLSSATPPPSLLPPPSPLPQTTPDPLSSCRAPSQSLLHLCLFLVPPHGQLSVLLSKEIKTLSLPASLPSHVGFFPAPCHSSHGHPGVSRRQAFSRQDFCG